MKAYIVNFITQVGYVNFTWKSGENKKYYYHFDRLQSFNEDILQPPTVSVEIRGRVPRKPRGNKSCKNQSQQGNNATRFNSFPCYLFLFSMFFDSNSINVVFSVLLPCSGNSSGVASFSVGLLIESHKGKPLPGTPLRLRLRKECAERGKPAIEICIKVFSLNVKSSSTLL